MRTRQWLVLVLLSAMLAGCPDSIKPPRKPPPGPHSPDAPRVPEPKVSAQAAAGKIALTVVPQSGQDSTLKRPPWASTR